MGASSRRAVLIGLCTALAACGGRAVPRDQDVYHEPSLRPGTVPADGEAERELLTRLPLPANEPVRLGDRVFVPLATYASASGRFCTPVLVRGEGPDRTRIACESGDGWVFVPDVFGGDDPFAGGAGAP
ncbi:MAG: hypothetical protein M3Y87_19710 [Myxococcota bacterium]|nr:hypothetical protein [Myxococcota bacterium]